MTQNYVKKKEKNEKTHIGKKKRAIKEVNSRKSTIERSEL